MYAERMVNELLEQGFPAYMDMSGPFHRVVVGGYDDLEDAIEAEWRLRRAGYDTLIIS